MLPFWFYFHTISFTKNFWAAGVTYIHETLVHFIPSSTYTFHFPIWTTPSHGRQCLGQGLPLACNFYRCQQQDIVSYKFGLPLRRGMGDWLQKNWNVHYCAKHHWELLVALTKLDKIRWLCVNLPLDQWKREWVLDTLTMTPQAYNAFIFHHV